MSFIWTNICPCITVKNKSSEFFLEWKMSLTKYQNGFYQTFISMSFFISIGDPTWNKLGYIGNIRKIPVLYHGPPIISDLVPEIYIGYQKNEILKKHTSSSLTYSKKCWILPIIMMILNNWWISHHLIKFKNNHQKSENRKKRYQ